MKWLQGVAAVTLVGLSVWWLVDREGDDAPPARSPSDELELKQGRGEPARPRPTPRGEVAPRVPAPELDSTGLSSLGQAVALMHPDGYLATCPVPEDVAEGVYRIGRGQGHGYVLDGEMVAVLPAGEGAGQVKTWDAIHGNLKWDLVGANPGSCVFSKPALQPVNLRVVDFDGNTIEGATIGGCPGGVHITSGPEGAAVAQLPEGSMCWAVVWRKVGNRVAWSKPMYGDPSTGEEVVLHLPKDEDLKTFEDHSIRMQPAVMGLGQILARQRADLPDVAALRGQTDSAEVERVLAVLDRHARADFAAWDESLKAMKAADPEALTGLVEGRFNR